MSRFKTLPEAIAHIEGYGASSTNRPTRNRNPGNINMAPWLAGAPYHAVMETMQPGVQPRFARFPTIEAGWAALKALLLSDTYRHLTIAQAINKYAPPIENTTSSYVAYVCAATGCQPADTVEKVMTVSA